MQFYLLNGAIQGENFNIESDLSAVCIVHKTQCLCKFLCRATPGTAGTFLLVFRAVVLARDTLASTSKDKALSIIDPRAKKIVASVNCHEGPKATKCCWVDGFAGSPGHILTTGSSKSNERELHLWDIKSFTKP